MCCERLQESVIQAANKHNADDPLRQALSKIAFEIVTECPSQVRSHTAKLTGTPLPPESEVIPNFLRKHPKQADILEESGALEPLLR